MSSVKAIHNKNLKRLHNNSIEKVSLWDNNPVNDPDYLNDYFRLFRLADRPKELMDDLACVAYNPMIQPYASMIALAASQNLLRANDHNARRAFLSALDQLCSPELAKKIDENLNYFTLIGKHYLQTYRQADIPRLVQELSGFTQDMDKKIATDFLSLLKLDANQ